MKLFTVDLTITTVVMAACEEDAHGAAMDNLYDIMHDNDPDVDVVGEITGLDRLPGNWDGDCLPYGGDGDIPLKDLLPETAPVRDTRTIDMFEERAA